MIELYTNIKNRRIELNITQSDLALKTGYADKSMIAKIEKGQIDLPYSKIAVFAKALDTTSRCLMGWDSKESQKARAKQHFKDLSQKSIERKDFVSKGHLLYISDNRFKRVTDHYYLLSDVGKKLAENLICQIDLYKTPMINAAHELPDASLEDKEYDNDIMDDENF